MLFGNSWLSWLFEPTRIPFVFSLFIPAYLLFFLGSCCCQCFKCTCSYPQMYGVIYHLVLQSILFVAAKQSAQSLLPVNNNSLLLYLIFLGHGFRHGTVWVSCLCFSVVSSGEMTWVIRVGTSGACIILFSLSHSTFSD